MTSEQPPRDAMRPLRPLPSIEVPLLREERSAIRSRRIIRLVIGLSVLAASAASAFFAIQHIERSEEAPAEPHPAAVASPAPASTLGAEAPPTPAAAQTEPHPSATGEQDDLEPPPPFKPGEPYRVERRFGRSVSFRDALEKNGLSRDEASALIAALDGRLDFRRSHPEDVMIIERDAYGELDRFEYRASLTQRYEAVRTDTGKLQARAIEVPVRTQQVACGGEVTGSLGDALEGLKLGRALVGVFSEVFEGQVNFSTDTRSGDSFRMIFDEEYVDDAFLRYGTVHALEYHGEKSGLLQAFWYEPQGGQGDFYDESGRAMHGGWLRTPLRYDHISSGFGMRFHPVLKRKRLHNGIDYAAATGTVVRAAAGGQVTFAGPKGPNGNLLSISHPNGYSTHYAHLSRFAPGIRRGVKVKQRQLVAYVGSTGRSTGPHLHFSLKRNGKFLDPTTQLNGPGLPLSKGELPAYKRVVRRWKKKLGEIQLQTPSPVASPEAPSDALGMGEEDL